MASIKIGTDHEDYDTIHAIWVENGRPSQFDAAGRAYLDYGGALYHVLDVGTDEPDFYQVASLPATTWDEDAHGKVTKGWDFINEEGWFQKLWQDHEGGFHTKYTPAPNEL